MNILWTAFYRMSRNYAGPSPQAGSRYFGPLTIFPVSSSYS